MEHNPPKHTVSVSALLMNEHDEVLLVRTHWRSDTWEMPGGNVDEGEPLDQAVCREFLEETGVVIRLRSELRAFTSTRRSTSFRLFSKPNM